MESPTTTYSLIPQQSSRKWTAILLTEGKVKNQNTIVNVCQIQKNPTSQGEKIVSTQGSKSK